MKKIICLMSLLSIFTIPLGCQSHQSDENIQRQEEQNDQAGDHLDRTIIPPTREFPDKGGGSGGR